MKVSCHRILGKFLARICSTCNFLYQYQVLCGYNDLTFIGFTLCKNMMGSSTNHGSGNDDPLGTPKSSELAPEKQSNDKKSEIEDEIDTKYESFKQFDTVQDHSDHHFRERDLNNYSKIKAPAKDWAKRIQSEWKILENNLPEMIYVRAYEDRMDLMRAVIIGAAGTPYHDGLFFFDILFPPNYPNVPPEVHYHSGGLTINPNLYPSGFVCLSLLGTWFGTGCEKWSPLGSTMLQVLVSIQGLVLNAKPYFNEFANRDKGEKESLAFNKLVSILSCCTMSYLIRLPLMHFDEFVTRHFRKRGPAILAAISTYVKDAPVGRAKGNDPQGGGGDDDGGESCSVEFERWLPGLFWVLKRKFCGIGADCGGICLSSSDLVRPPPPTSAGGPTPPPDRDVHLRLHDPSQQWVPPPPPPWDLMERLPPAAQARGGYHYDPTTGLYFWIPFAFS